MFHKHYQCLFYGILCPSFVPVSPFLVHWSLHPISLVCILLACMDCCFVYSNNSVCLLWHTLSLRVQYVDFISNFVYFSPQVLHFWSWLLLTCPLFPKFMPFNMVSGLVQLMQPFLRITLLLCFSITASISCSTFFFTANSDCGLKKQGVALPAANTHLNNFWNARLDIVMYPQTDDWLIILF